MTMIEMKDLKTMNQDLWRANIATSLTEIFLSLIGVYMFAFSHPKWNEERKHIGGNVACFFMSFIFCLIAYVASTNSFDIPDAVVT